MGGVTLVRPPDAVPWDERPVGELGPDEGYIDMEDFEGRWDPHASGIWRGERVPDEASAAAGCKAEPLDWSLALLRRSEEHGTLVGAGALDLSAPGDAWGTAMVTFLLEGEYSATSSRHGTFSLTQTYNPVGDDPDPGPTTRAPVAFRGSLRIPEGAPRTATGMIGSGSLPRVAALRGEWQCERDGTRGTFTASLVDPEPDDEPKMKTQLDEWHEAEHAYF